MLEKLMICCTFERKKNIQVYKVSFFQNKEKKTKEKNKKLLPFIFKSRDIKNFSIKSPAVIFCSGI